MLGTTRLFRDDIGFEPDLSPREAERRLCPVCGAETFELVRDLWGDTVGCPACVYVADTEEGTEYELERYRIGGE